MSLEFKFLLPDKLYLRDPQETSFGKRLLASAIALMDSIGFEAFTFKKCAEHMGSSEVSIYRYFTNKHLLLLYLNCWYWEWINYLMERRTLNIDDPEERLRRAIHCLIYASDESETTDYIDAQKLRQIMMKESSKSYHIHDIDEENAHGLFMPYKQMIKRLAEIALQLNPKFPYPRTLCTTVFEMCTNQLYYAEHLPRLSDIDYSDAPKQRLEKIANHLMLSALKG